MLSASLYITICTARNRTRRWLRRLKEPRYLAGLVIAAMYFYVTLFARTRAARGPRARPSLAAFPALAGLVPELAAIALLVAAAAVWLLPTSGRLLDFAPAEVQFLFPAPASRRSLLIHRLLRSQSGLLFASLVPALVVSIPVGSATLAVRTALGIWVLLVAARVYFSAIALARSRLSSPDFKLRRLARLPLVIVLAGVLAVGSALVREYLRQPFAGLDDATSRITTVLALGPQRVVLWPFVTLVRPFFASDWSSYTLAVLWSALVAIAAMVWLVASDDVFQGASSVLIEAKEGRPEAGKASYAARRAIWTLAPTGRPEAAFIWKTTQQVFRVVDRRVLARLVLILVALSMLVVFSSRTEGVAGIGGIFATFGAVYVVLLAPQILRLDMRQDLQHLELLKTWPVRGAAVVRGEMTGPALVLAAGAWLLMGLGLLFSGSAFRGVPLVWRGAVAAGGFVLGPALIFGQYAIHNAMALLLPAWIPLGSGRPRGLDAMGQRFLLLGATWLALAIMLLPGALVSALLWLAFYRMLGAGMVVVAAILCAAAMAIEILMMSEALGPAYERLDLLAIERPD